MKSHDVLRTDRTTRIVLFTLLAAVFLCLSSGCVRRRMTVRTNPVGATAYLDNKPIGKTPLTTGFTHYGDRKFTFVKEGYETRTVILPVRAPWYEWIGLDFVSEVLLPGKLRDHKYYEVDMFPQQIMPQDALIAQAEEMRRLTHSGQSLRLTDPLPTLPAGEPLGGSIAPPEPLLPSAPTAAPYAPYSPPGTGLSGEALPVPIQQPYPQPQPQPQPQPFSPPPGPY